MAVPREGTPQGASWSPTLWAMAISDLPFHIDGEVICFADDTNVVVSDPDPKRAQEKMDKAMDELSRYLRANRILPAADKT